MIPLDIIIGGGSAILGIVSTLLKQNQENKVRIEQSRIAAMSQQAAIHKEIRESENQGVAWTRRSIAIMMCISVFVLPLLSPFLTQTLHNLGDMHLMEVPIRFGYVELVSGFWPFTETVTRTVWVGQEGGYVITPWHTQTFSAAVGFYFGSKK